MTPIPQVFIEEFSSSVHSDHVWASSSSFEVCHIIFYLLHGLNFCFQKLDHYMSRGIVNEQQIILIAIDRSLIIFSP